MRLGIDIDEYEYEKVKELVSSGIFDYEGITPHLYKSVANGIVLPIDHDKEVLRMNKPDILLELDNLKTYHANSISRDQFVAVEKAMEYIRAWDIVIKEIEEQKQISIEWNQDTDLGVALKIIDECLSEVEKE